MDFVFFRGLCLSPWTVSSQSTSHEMVCEDTDHGVHGDTDHGVRRHRPRYTKTQIRTLVYEDTWCALQQTLVTV